MKIAMSVYCIKFSILKDEFELIEDVEFALLKQVILSIEKTSLELFSIKLYIDFSLFYFVIYVFANNKTQINKYYN